MVYFNSCIDNSQDYGAEHPIDHGAENAIRPWLGILSWPIVRNNSMDYGEESANRLQCGRHCKTTVRKSCGDYFLPQIIKGKGRAGARPFPFFHGLTKCEEICIIDMFF